MNEYQNPQNCGSPHKYFGGSNVNDVGNSYGTDEVQNNAQSDMGFSAPQNNTKKYVCRNCGTVHNGPDKPSNCCKCDCCDFRES